MKPTELAAQWMADIERELSTYVERTELREGQRVTCRACSEAIPGCCLQKIMVHAFEVVPIAQWLRDRGADTPEFRARLRLLGREQNAMTEDEWFSRAEPCVFLTTEGRCDIYDIRPVACRSYFVMNPSSACCPPCGQTVKVLGCGPASATQTAGFGREWARSIGLREELAYFDWLPRALLRMLMAWERKDPIGYMGRQSWPRVKDMPKELQ